MAGNKVRKAVYALLGKQDEQQPLHIQTVKITLMAHAKLRALADLTGRSKTPIAAELLMAAIDDAIDALPNDPLDEATADKLRGIVKKWGVTSYKVGDTEYDFEPRGMRDIVLERADNYLLFDKHERLDDEGTLSSSELVSENGAHE